MKTLDELMCYAQGYHDGCVASHEDGDVSGVEDWIVWGGYDINFSGCEMWNNGTLGKHDLRVAAYPEGWTKNLPDPVHTFTLKAD